MDPRLRNERKAWLICEQAFAKLAEDDCSLRARVVDLISLWEAKQTCDASYPRRWRHLIELPCVEARAIVMADNDEGLDLRTTNPFAGLFTPVERRALLAAVGL